MFIQALRLSDKKFKEQHLKKKKNLRNSERTNYFNMLQRCGGGLMVRVTAWQTEGLQFESGHWCGEEVQ